MIFFLPEIRFCMCTLSYMLLHFVILSNVQYLALLVPFSMFKQNLSTYEKADCFTFLIKYQCWP